MDCLNGKKVDRFDGEYAYLSNFYPAATMYGRLIYPSSETAYQAAKCVNPGDTVQFTGLSAKQAKRRGRQIKLREDWDEIRLQVMYDVVYAKFSQNPDLARKLIDTYPTYLEEGNTWGDTFWGVSNGAGSNHLGKILMQVREELKTQEEAD